MSKLWTPDFRSGEYKLAPSIRERVIVYLKSFKNREAAFKLAVWLARMNAAPQKIDLSFAVDRRGISSKTDLDLTEAQVRGALGALLKIGFIEPVKPSADSNRYHTNSTRRGSTPAGPCRVAIRYRFSFEFLKIFRYIASRFPKSPKDRLDINLLEDSPREAPLLGDLVTATRRLFAHKAREVVNKPLGVLKAWDEANPLDGALERMQRLMGARKASVVVDGAST